MQVGRSKGGTPPEILFSEHGLGLTVSVEGELELDSKFVPEGELLMSGGRLTQEQIKDLGKAMFTIITEMIEENNNE